jgi:hypothetical protein
MAEETELDRSIREKAKRNKTLSLNRKPIAESVAEYKQVMTDYVINLWETSYRGIGLAELNRRFCQLGSQFDVSPNQMVGLLCDEGVLSHVRHGRSVIILPPYYMEIFDVRSEVAMEALDKMLTSSLEL